MCLLSAKQCLSTLHMLTHWSFPTLWGSTIIFSILQRRKPNPPPPKKKKRTSKWQVSIQPQMLWHQSLNSSPPSHMTSRLSPIILQYLWSWCRSKQDSYGHTDSYGYTSDLLSWYPRSPMQNPKHLVTGPFYLIRIRSHAVSALVSLV